MRDGRIVAVGSNNDVLNLKRPHTKVVDLNGAALLPGFNDAHCHILSYGLQLDMVPLSFPAVANLAELRARLAERAAAGLPHPGGWIRAVGYDQNLLAEHRHPDRRDLDNLPGDPYVLASHASGHAISVNSAVLRLAGITRDTPDPIGGTIDRDSAGQPTGVLFENAIEIAYAVAPPPTSTQNVAAINRASAALNTLGITSASDASTSLVDIPVFRKAAESGEMTVRCTLMILLDQLMADGQCVPYCDLAADNHGDLVRIGAAKIFSDGAISTRTALLREPYVNTRNEHGTAIWERSEFESHIARAHVAGWQVATHAIGDGAIDLCLDAYAAAQRQLPRADARHRIEHAEVLWGDQIARMAAQHVLPVFQPEFITRFGDTYINTLGKVLADRIKPFRETQAAGLPLIFSSDLPVVPGAPLDGIAAGISRKTAAGAVLDASQSATIEQAFRAYTAGAAYSAFAEQDRGTISNGMRADFVVLDSDPMALSVEEWAEGPKVVGTIVGGNIASGEF